MRTDMLNRTPKIRKVKKKKKKKVIVTKCVHDTGCDVNKRKEDS